MANEPTWRVATYTGDQGNCVEVASWRVATYTGGSGDCVEVGDTGHTILIRDSKDRAGGTLTFPATSWQAFANSLK
jgi:Domain of unknown function (DUF397)